MNCETCKERERQVSPVPYIVHESAMARMERTVKKLWILLIILAVFLVGSNIAWIVYESQFMTEYAEVDVDTGDGDAYVAGIGDVTVGESKGENQKANP